MANEYYDHGSVPATGAPGSSSAIRAEFDAVEAGFAKLPAMSGYANKAIVVNTGGTGLTVTAGDLALSGALTTVGGYALTLTLTGATGITLPTTGTLATLAGAEALTNKTINLTSNTLTGTLAQFNTACSNADFCSLTGSETLTNKTLTSPVLTTPSFSGNVSTNISISTASSPRLAISTTHGTNRTAILDFQLNGTSKWLLCNDQGQGNNNEFSIYDAEASLYRVVISSSGVVQIASGATLQVSGRAYTPTSSYPYGASLTLDTVNSNYFEVGALTGNVTSLTLSNAIAGHTITIRFKQDGTGGRTVASPAGAKIAGSIDLTASVVSHLTLTYSLADTRWEGYWSSVPA